MNITQLLPLITQPQAPRQVIPQGLLFWILPHDNSKEKYLHDRIAKQRPILIKPLSEKKPRQSSKHGAPRDLVVRKKLPSPFQKRQLGPPPFAMLPGLTSSQNNAIKSCKRHKAKPLVDPDDPVPKMLSKQVKLTQTLDKLSQEIAEFEIVLEKAESLLQTFTKPFDIQILHAQVQHMHYSLALKKDALYSQTKSLNSLKIKILQHREQQHLKFWYLTLIRP